MKLLEIVPSAKVYVYNKAVHMQCSFPSLTRIVKEELERDIKEGDLYLFMSRSFTYVKILFWAKGGPCILAKKLDHGVFKLRRDSGTLTISGLQNVIEY